MPKIVYTYFDTAPLDYPTENRIEAYLTQLSSPPPNFTLHTMRLETQASDSEAISKARKSRLAYERLKWRQTAPRYTPTLGQAAQVGTNIADGNYYSSALPFVDISKHSDSWRADGFTPTFDSQGYCTGGIPPGQRIWSLCAEKLRDAGVSHYPSGTYHLLWDGDGTTDVGPNESPLEVEVGRDCTSFTLLSPGHATFTIDASLGQGFLFTQFSTLPSPNHIRNIRAVHSQFLSTYATDPFHPDFLNKLLPYSAIRLMDWQATNNSTHVNWSDRATLGSKTYATAGGTEGIVDGRGVPLELGLQLAVRLDFKHIHVCIPHLSTDAYVTSIAQLVKANYSDLVAGSKVSWEYSNEIWNSGFTQSAYAQQQGDLLWPGEGSQFDRKLRFAAWRSKQCMTLIAAVYGSEMNAKCNRVFGAQFSNPYTGYFPLDNLADDGQPCYKHHDAITVAPYFGHHLGRDPLAATVQNWTLAQLVLECYNEIFGNSPYEADPWYAHDIPSLMRQWVQVADTRVNLAGRSLFLTAYEGGQHLVGVGGSPAWNEDQELNALFILFQRTTSGADTYRSLLNLWRTGGNPTATVPNPTCQTFFVFSNTYRISGPPWYGFWGYWEWQDGRIGDLGAAKAGAIEDWSRKNLKAF